MFNARRKFKVLVKVIVAKAKFERQLMEAKSLSDCLAAESPVLTRGWSPNSARSLPGSTPMGGHALSFLEKYEILEEIGKDKISKLYRGWDKMTNKAIAIKIIDRSHLNSISEQKIKSEYSLNQAINDHPNILMYCDFYEDSKSFLIAMELSHGVDLVGSVISHTSYSEYDARLAVYTILTVIEQCHSRNIAHR